MAENWSNFSNFLGILPHAFACIRECLIFFQVFYDEIQDKFYFPEKIESTFEGVERLPRTFLVSHCLLESTFQRPGSSALRAAYILTKRLFRAVKMDDDKGYFDYYIKLRPESDNIPDRIDSWGPLQYADAERI